MNGKNSIRQLSIWGLVWNLLVEGVAFGYIWYTVYEEYAFFTEATGRLSVCMC